MKSTKQNVTAAMVVLICGAAAAAQTPAQAPDRDRTATPRDANRGTMHTENRPEAGTNDRAPKLVPGEWLIGQKVLGSDRKSLGRIKDLILDADDGHIVYAVLNRAPREDATPATVAVPWLAFTWDGIDRVLVLPVSRDRLAEARMFDTKRWELLNDPTWTEETYGYFDAEPDGYADGWDGDIGHGLDADEQRRMEAEPGPADRRDVDGREREERNTDAQDRDRHDRDGRNRSVDSARNIDGRKGPKQYVMATKVEGQTLRGAEDKEIGDVEALVFDSGSGRMAFIVAAFGGFLGIGDSKVAVPWDYFKVNDEGQLYTNEVKAEEVRTAPRIEREDWSELRDPEFGPRVYDHFGRDATWFHSGFRDGRQSLSDSDSDDDNTLYADGTPGEITGTVSRVSDAEAADGHPAVRTVVISTDSGDRLVHLAPASYLEEKGCALKEGDRVTIKGNTTMVNGKQVLIASSVKGPQNKIFDLRDGQGQPQWRDGR